MEEIYKPNTDGPEKVKYIAAKTMICWEICPNG